MTEKEEKLSRLQGEIWFDGKFTNWQEATTHVLSHGLHYGTGVFDGVRAYATSTGPAIFRLPEHTNRLLTSAKIIGMEIPYSYQQLYDAQLQAVAINNLDDAYIRPLAFYDSTSLGISVQNHEVHVCIATWKWGPYLGKEALEKGIHVGVSSFRRPDPNGAMCHAKVCGNYINSVLAKQEAQRAGFAEALLLDSAGCISEGSGENIFVVFGDQLVTPYVHSALNGITRQTIMQLAQDLGIEVREHQLARDELYGADEAFFTGTAAEVTPICMVDHRAIGSGKPGPVTQKIQETYFNCVQGKDERYEDWLTHVTTSVS